MIKSIALALLILWGALLAGAVLRVPEQMQKSLVRRSEVPTNAN
jgi:hypothetical protein